ncbi:MAG: hypothetical protein KGQ41_06470 [Alphaproteobacteria bacterium]|nr:hypothetical protein [Alphaproteobacteria bacterium]
MAKTDKKLFETALVILDEHARPILIIPDELPDGETFLNIVEGGIDIGVGKTLCGKIRKMDEATLTMLGLQDEVGMVTFKGHEGEEMPDTVQYVAKVYEKRAA